MTSHYWALPVYELIGLPTVALATCVALWCIVRYRRGHAH
jgi:hypothetical protein